MVGFFLFVEFVGLEGCCDFDIRFIMDYFDVFGVVVIVGMGDVFVVVFILVEFGVGR